MQAVILAAGEGTRLRPLTLDKPKPLVEINGKSILEYSMENLIGLVDEIIIIIGYMGEKIKKKFGDNFKGMRLTYVEQKQMLGTGYALSLVEDLVKDRFIVLMGDNIYSKKDIENCLRYDLCVLAEKVENPEDFGILLIEDNNVKAIIEKPKKFIGDLANTALYVLDKKIFNELKNLEKSERGELELTDGVTSLAQNNEIKCVKAEFFIPISYHEDLERAKKILRRG